MSLHRTRSHITLKVTCLATLQIVHWYNVRARQINVIKISKEKKKKNSNKKQCLLFTLGPAGNSITSTNYFHLARFRWNYCRDLLKMWKRESIAFRRHDRRSRTGCSVVVCISASEGSWNLIIVHHTPGKPRRWGACCGCAGVLLRLGAPTCSAPNSG